VSCGDGRSLSIFLLVSQYRLSVRLTGGISPKNIKVEDLKASCRRCTFADKKLLPQVNENDGIRIMWKSQVIIIMMGRLSFFYYIFSSSNMLSGEEILLYFFLYE
jgi:hypothetical protein